MKMTVLSTVARTFRRALAPIKNDSVECNFDNDYYGDQKCLKSKSFS